MNVTVATPYPIDSTRGNSVSARRIVGILRELALEAEIQLSDGPATNADALVALHARKSGAILRAFSDKYPDRPCILLLTGSDLHIDLPMGGEKAAEVIDSMERATQLVVAQEGSVSCVPERFYSKLSVIPKSVDIALPAYAPPASKNPFRVVIAAHLRPLKDPFRAADAARLLPADSPVQIEHFGGLADAEMQARAEWETHVNPHYAWRGAVDREQMITELATAHLHLNTALMEGGANSIAEAMLIGLPIIATQIPGNTGMLGTDYPGYFEPRNTEQLATLLQCCATEEPFLTKLQTACKQRSKLFTREAERLGWRSLFL
jgi:glycosyltransferase involved in cell wall biosynthesis